MRELRVQSGGHPLRIFYAFDPRRAAILLIGGDKTGDDNFYARSIPIADKLFDEHLAQLKKEKKNGGKICDSSKQNVSRSSRAGGTEGS
jgi:hypothetical protein